VALNLNPRPWLFPFYNDPDHLADFRHDGSAKLRHDQQRALATEQVEVDHCEVPLGCQMPTENPLRKPDGARVQCVACDDQKEASGGKAVPHVIFVRSEFTAWQGRQVIETSLLQGERVVEQLCDDSSPALRVVGQLRLDDAYPAAGGNQKDVDRAGAEVDFGTPCKPGLVRRDASRLPAWSDHKFWIGVNGIPEPRLGKPQFTSRYSLMRALQFGRCVPTHRMEQVISDCLHG